MENHNMNAADLPKAPNKLKQSIVKLWRSLISKPIYLFIAIFALIGTLTLLYSFAASDTLTGRISAKDPTSSHTISVGGSGELTATVNDTDNNTNKGVRFVLTLTNSDTNQEITSYTATSPGDPVTLVADVTPATYKLTVSSLDRLENRPKPYEINVTYPDPPIEPEPIDTQQPTISITQPTSGETGSNSITVSGVATDNISVSRVDYRFAGSHWQTALGTTDWTGTLDTTILSDGIVTIEAKAVDEAGNSSTASLEIAIKNQTDGSNGGDTDSPASSSKAIWISADDIKPLPTSGRAWNNLENVALGDLGTVRLDDNNSNHDTSVLALAYYAVRNNDTNRKQQVASEIDTVQYSARARALEFCRNITSYIIAADIIDLKSLNSSIDNNFRSFIQKWVLEDESLQGHSGKGIKGTAANAPNNWGGMCRAAYSATAFYLNNKSAQDNVTSWHKSFLGDRSVPNTMVYRSTNWHAVSNDKVGINRKGATIQGHNVDGVIPEDQRRTGEFEWPAPQGSYPWEAMQGALVTDVILQRAGRISATHEDSAMVRAWTWLYTVNNNPAVGDDRWQIWVANKYYGTNFPTETGVSPGKLMGWTDWTHQ